MAGLTLPDAPWRQRPGLARLIVALGPGSARIVGGAVRDTLLGIATGDVDLATVHPPERVIALLEAAGIKAIPTGLAHGTITAVADGETYEVTTLRRDVATDGRHATVAFSDDWREDAARRDFTINALYADPVTGELFDYFGGLDDLKARHIRFIGDPLQRIAEDHLRILRFFRFLARFGDTPDPAGLESCAARANDLMALSRERIANELLRLLVAPHAVRVVALMLEYGIFTPVLPEITNLARLERIASREQAADKPNPLRRIVALLDPADTAEVAARLKLSNDDRKRIEIAARPLLTANERELAYRLGLTGARDQLLLSDLPDDETTAKLHALGDWSPPRLPITGGAIVARGVGAGPEVARLLRRIEDRWIAEGFPPAERVDQIADELVQALRAASSE